MYFHGDDGGQSFARVIAAGRDFRFFQEASFFHVGVQGAGHRRAETGQVGAAVALWDVVGEAVDVFLVAVVPLQGDFDVHAVFVGAAIEDGGVDGGFVAVEVFGEGAHAAFVFVGLGFVGAFVAQGDAHARVQEGEFLQAFGKGVVVVNDIAKGIACREEVDFGAALCRIADDGKRRVGFAVVVVLPVDVAVAADGHGQAFGEGVDHGDADAV